MTSSPLAIYLNDHLAGATAGLELARRARGRNAGTPLGELDDPRLASFDFGELVARAERQLDDVERHRLAVGLTALASDA